MSGEKLSALLDAAAVLATVLTHEASRLLAGLQAPPVEPWVPAVCGVVLLLAAGAWLYRRSRRSGGIGRSDLARSLAAQGVASAEIARRTGLSRDAVAMLLPDGPAAVAGRRNLPAPARSSAPAGPRRGLRWGAASPQAAAGK